MAATLSKLAPFALRAGIVVKGRGKLRSLGRRLQFVLITSDASEGTRRQMTRWVPCPVIRALSSADVADLFGLVNTKVVGFLASPLAATLYKTLVETPDGAGDTTRETVP